MIKFVVAPGITCNGFRMTIDPKMEQAVADFFAQFEEMERDRGGPKPNKWPLRKDGHAG